MDVKLGLSHRRRNDDFGECGTGEDIWAQVGRNTTELEIITW
jgi:hypothetical protein